MRELTMQAKGRALLRPRTSKSEYRVTTPTFTTVEPASVPSLTWTQVTIQNFQRERKLHADLFLSFNTRVLTRGDIFPTALSPFTWVVHHLVTWYRDGLNWKMWIYSRGERKTKEKNDTWWKWLQKRIRAVVRPTRSDAERIAPVMGSSLY